MDVLHLRCCGLDVHKSSISACILLREAGRVQKHQRRFGAMTQELQELAEWLRQFGVTQVAMESSGVYWKPVWNFWRDSSRTGPSASGCSLGRDKIGRASCRERV